MDIEEVRAAKSIRIKKIIEIKVPIGIFVNIAGRVIKISDGPWVGSTPKAKTAGMMAMAAKYATDASMRGIETEDLIMLASFFI